MAGLLGAGSGWLAIFEDEGFDEIELVTSAGGVLGLLEAKGLLTSKRPESEQPLMARVMAARAVARAQFRARGDTTDADIRLLTHTRKWWSLTKHRGSK